MTTQNMRIFGVIKALFSSEKQELNGEEGKLCTYPASAVVCVVSVWNNVGIRDASSSSD